MSLGYSIDGIGFPQSSDISSDLAALVFPPTVDVWAMDSATRHGELTLGRLPTSMRYGAEGFTLKTFMDDFYYRVYVEPLTIDLGVMASAQTRTIAVWNAWPYTNGLLQDIVLSDAVGITITGSAPPLTLHSLEEMSWDFEIDALGPLQIATTVLFDFSDLASPPAATIVGQRAVRFDLIPEEGVKETWEWLTDIIESSDGTEQRIALRGSLPRTILEFSVKFTESDPIRRYANDLWTADNAFWVPEWQYGTHITQGSSASSTRLYFDPLLTDIRAGEYIMLITPDKASYLVQVSSMTGDGCILQTPLAASVAPYTFVSPGSPSLLEDSTPLSRAAVNHYATTQIKATFNRRRSLPKPGTVSPIPVWAGLPVLDAHPKIEDSLREELLTNLQVLDNKIGEVKYFKVWDYARLIFERSYLVKRTPITSCQTKYMNDIDYFRHFFNLVRGPQKKFWASTWRQDFTLLTTPGPGTNTFLTREVEYAQKVFGSYPTHRFLEIETEGGTHRATVNVAVEESGGTRLVFSPAVPSGPGWTDIKRISYLFPCRLNGDSVEFVHYNNNSILNISLRLAEV